MKKFKRYFNDDNLNHILYIVNKQSVSEAVGLILLSRNYSDAFLILSTPYYRNKMSNDLAVKLIDLIFDSQGSAPLLLVRAHHTGKGYIGSAKECELKCILEHIASGNLKNNDQIFKIVISKLKYHYDLNKKIKRLKLSEEVYETIISMLVTTSLSN